MNYCFASNGSLQQMAILASPKSGRLLEVKSTLPGLQVYTGNWLNTKGKFNVDYVSMINNKKHEILSILYGAYYTDRYNLEHYGG